MLWWSGKRPKGFIRKLPSQSWKWPYLIARSTSISGMTLVRTHPAAVRKLFTSPGIADWYALLMNLWNSLPESYQQWVYYNTLCHSQASDPTGGEPSACRGDQRGSSACLQCYSSWLFVHQSGAWGACDREPWPKHPIRQPFHGWWTLGQDARGQRGLKRWRWWKRHARCHPHHQPVMTACNWTPDVWPWN